MKSEELLIHTVNRLELERFFERVEAQTYVSISVDVLHWVVHLKGELESETDESDDLTRLPTHTDNTEDWTATNGQDLITSTTWEDQYVLPWTMYNERERTNHQLNTEKRISRFQIFLLVSNIVSELRTRTIMYVRQASALRKLS